MTSKPEKQVRNSLPGTFVRRTSKAVTGGAALMFAFLMLMLFRIGGGGGTSSDSGSSDTSTAPSRPALVSTSAPAQSATKSVQPDDADRVAGLTDDERRALSGDVLTVAIDEYRYLLEIRADGQVIEQASELPRIVELAERARGDSNGIRVRIVRRATARVSAEEKLRNELSRIGIGANAIHATDGWVP